MMERAWAHAFNDLMKPWGLRICIYEHGSASELRADRIQGVGGHFRMWSFPAKFRS